MYRGLKSTLYSLAFLGICSVAHARTGNELVLDLRLMLGQTTASVSNWSNAQLYQALNIAQDKVTARGRVIEKDTAYAGGATTSAGNLRLNRPSGFITLRGTAYLMKNGLEIKPIVMISADSLGRTQTRITRQNNGEDNFNIYEESDDIVVSPAIQSGDSVKVIYFANPAVIDSASECAYGDEWEMVLLYEAKMISLEKIRDEEWYALTMKERDDMLQQMYAQTKARPQLVKVP